MLIVITNAFAFVLDHDVPRTGQGVVVYAVAEGPDLVGVNSAVCWKTKTKVSLASKDGKTYGTLIEEQNYKTLTLVLVTLEVVEDALIRQDR